MLTGGHLKLTLATEFLRCLSCQRTPAVVKLCLMLPFLSMLWKIFMLAQRHSWVSISVRSWVLKVSSWAFHKANCSSLGVEGHCFVTAARMSRCSLTILTLVIFTTSLFSLSKRASLARPSDRPRYTGGPVCASKYMFGGDETLCFWLCVVRVSLKISYKDAF